MAYYPKYLRLPIDDIEIDRRSPSQRRRDLLAARRRVSYRRFLRRHGHPLGDLLVQIKDVEVLAALTVPYIADAIAEELAR